MIVSEVILNNFGKYQKEITWKVKPGLFIVSGKNGSGKSTLFVESLAWCLFGDTYRNTKADDVINDNNNVCYVILKTDIGEFKRIKERGKKSILYVNNTIMTDNDVVNLIGLDKKLFFNSIVFGSGLDGFIRVSGTERKTLLSVCFSSMDDIIVRIVDKEKEIENECELLKKEIEFVKEKIQNFKSKIGDLNDLEKNKKILENKLDIYYKKLQKYDNMYNTRLKLIEDNSITEKFQSSIENLSNKLINLLKRYTGLEFKEKLFNEEIEKINKLEATCYVCKQSVSDKYKMKLIRKYERLISELKTEKSILKIKIDKLEQKKQKMEKLKESEIANYKKNLYKELSDYKSIIDELKTKILNIKERLYDIKDKIEKSKELKSLIKQKSDLINKLDDYEKKLKGFQFWKKQFLKFKTDLVYKIMQKFDSLGNKYLLGLSNGRFTFNFKAGLKGNKVLKEDYSIVIKDRDKVVDFNRLSNGEKRIITLGMNMCFKHVMNTFYAKDWNIMIFDEVFDGLDSKVRERVIDMLLELFRETNKCIIVITHDNFDYKSEQWKGIVVNGKEF